jgi:hypothetical protein
MMTAAQALMELERRMLSVGARVARYRFLPYPSTDQKSIVCCAELPNGEEFQIVYRLDYAVPIDDSYDEDAIAEAFFATPSRLVH